MKRHETRLLALALLALTVMLLIMPLHVRRTERLIFRTESMRLEIGQQAYLRYVLETDSDRAPQFRSDAPLVVGVDQTGLVTAISPGTAHITLTAGEKLSATAEVAVYGMPVTQLKLDADALTLQKGQRTRLTATLNEGVTDGRVFWSSDDERVASVNAAGMIEAVGGGLAHVRATTVNGLTAEAEVRVEVALQQAAIEPALVVAGVGARIPLKAALTPEDTTERVVSWESTDEAVLRVSETGTVDCVGIGTAQVRMILTNAQAAYADFNVQQRAERVSLRPTVASVSRGAEILLTASIEPERSLSHYVVWESDSPQVAKVTDGVVRGLAAGTARITAIVDGVRSEPCEVTVRVVPENLRLDVRELALSVADTAQPVRLRAEIAPADAENPTVYFACDAPAVASVDEQGIVSFTGSAGMARITAYTENGLSDTCVITVSD